MFSFKKRYETFKDWPFGENEKCSPEKMAQAGFYKLPGTEDEAKCYYCCKELDGWECDDDPFDEHRKHASYCPLVKMFKDPPTCVTLEQVIELEEARTQLHLEKMVPEEKKRINYNINKSKEDFSNYYDKCQ